MLCREVNVYCVIVFHLISVKANSMINVDRPTFARINLNIFVMFVSC